MHVHLPSMNVNLPSTNVNLPSTNVNLPSTNVNLPSTNVNLPSTNVNLPSTNVNLPSMNVNLPSTNVNLLHYVCVPFLLPCLAASVGRDSMRNMTSKYVITFISAYASSQFRTVTHQFAQAMTCWPQDNGGHKTCLWAVVCLFHNFCFLFFSEIQCLYYIKLENLK
ncbi:unnamed protein product [Candidula unifasciata]|uniref:Uncharacterized protein n=1 Tax=Candidula unifasciata TaxID=100452 RepID=A0A8S3ZA88_9EUPU|nr:unnamed protein product [Candidula unifasciata]